MNSTETEGFCINNFFRTRPFFIFDDVTSFKCKLLARASFRQGLKLKSFASREIIMVGATRSSHVYLQETTLSFVYLYCLPRLRRLKSLAQGVKVIALRYSILIQRTGLMTREKNSGPTILGA